MHEGLVHSLQRVLRAAGGDARAAGSDRLRGAARHLADAVEDNPSRAVRDTLPQVGYGQADVRATPLRMARVAAAIAATGVLRDARWEQDLPTPEGEGVSVTGRARSCSASDMRDVVLNGTGRSLRSHPWRIAGKTGTAEVDGAPSHGWFVGFAPYGPATKRIAFAIVIENAGYGGASAAPVAGEIVTAAGLSRTARSR